MQVSACVAALLAKEEGNGKPGGGLRKYKKPSEIRRERSSYGREPGLHLTNTYIELQTTVPSGKMGEVL